MNPAIVNDIWVPLLTLRNMKKEEGSKGIFKTPKLLNIKEIEVTVSS